MRRSFAQTTFKSALFWIGFHATFFSFLPARAAEEKKLSLDNPVIRQSFIEEIRKFNTGESNCDIALTIQEKFGVESYAREKPRGLRAFEDDIISLFEVAPELRSIEMFSQKWKLSQKELLDVMTYYGLNMFSDLEAIASTKEVLERLQKVSRLYFLQHSDHPAARRYPYYVKQITRKSVPEMSKEQGITEGQVYQELSLLQVSIAQRFKEPLRFFERKIIEKNLLKQDFAKVADDLKTLLESNPRISLEELLFKGMALKEDDDYRSFITQLTESSPQAFEFIWHHRKEKNRGVTWNRMTERFGMLEQEVEVLVRLHEEGVTVSEITLKLNEVFPATETEFRTEGSVKEKLSALGLTNSIRTGLKEIYDPRYGYLKQSGQLNPSSVISFLLDHSHKGDDWIAAQLSIQVDSLREFYVRHHLVRKIMKSSGAELLTVDSSSEVNRVKKARLEKYAEQIRVVNLTLEEMKKRPRLSWLNRLAPLRHRDLETTPGVPNLSKIFSIYPYTPKGPQAHLGIFKSSVEFWLAVKEKAKKEGLFLSLTDLDITLTEQEGDFIRPQMQADALEILKAWYLVNKKPLKFETLRKIKKDEEKNGIAIDPSKLSGANRYKKELKAHRIFDSYEEYVLRQYKKLLEDGIKISLFDFIFFGGIQSDELRQLRKEEALEVLLSLLAKNNGSMRTLAKQAGEQLDIGASALVYQEAVQSKNSIFSDSLEMAMLVREKAKQRDIPCFLASLVLRDEKDVIKLLPFIRVEFFEKMIKRWEESRQLPTIRKIRDQPIGEGLLTNRIFSRKSYSDGTGLFTGIKEAYNELLKYIQDHPEVFSKEGEDRQKKIADLEAYIATLDTEAE